MLLLETMSFSSESDRVKFTELYEQYAQLMYKCAYSVLNDTQLAEDAVQDALLKISQNMSGVSDVAFGRTASFVVTVTKNCAYDIIRKRKNENFLENMADIPDNKSIEDDILSSVSQERIVSYIAQLPQDYKTVLILKYVHSLSDKQIAKLTDCTKQSVSMKAFRARRLLCKIITEKEGK